MEYIYIYIFGVTLMIAFLFGLKVGLSLYKGKDIELNPIKAVTKVIKDTKEYMEETIGEEKAKEDEAYRQQGIQNIMNFDGTARSQK